MRKTLSRRRGGKRLLGSISDNAECHATQYTLHHGDCLAILRTLPEASVDAIITDPPDGIGKAEWDSYFPKDWFYEARRVAKPDAVFIILTSSGKAMQEALNLLGNLYQSTFVAWLTNGMTRGHISFGNWIAVNIGSTQMKWKPMQDVIRVTLRSNEKVKHPSPKPPQLMKAIINRLTEQDWTILDPFMGSGTTGIACVSNGRNFVGIEREAEYFALAQSRIEKAAAQLRLFTDAA
jgi:site-specific DNA-methyltransferase (adenine-specific)